MSHPIIEQLKRDLAAIEMHERSQNILRLIEDSTEGLDILGQAPLDPNDFPTELASLEADYDFDLVIEDDYWDDDVVTAVQPYETMQELVYGS